tara:strand:- start:588 stop:752 length:165 start_codon:yes stop_codon:yes gene_type:complete
VLFVYWGVASAVTGDVFLLETIRRRDDPVLFWIIVAMWIGFGLMYVAYDALPYL